MHEPNEPLLMKPSPTQLTCVEKVLVLWPEIPHDFQPLSSGRVLALKANERVTQHSRSEEGQGTTRNAITEHMTASSLHQRQHGFNRDAIFSTNTGAVHRSTQSTARWRSGQLHSSVSTQRQASKRESCFLALFARGGYSPVKTRHNKTPRLHYFSPNRPTFLSFRRFANDSLCNSPLLGSTNEELIHLSPTNKHPGLIQRRNSLTFCLS